MPNRMEKIQKYITEAIDTVMVLDSTTNDLVDASKFIDLNFKEAGYVKVMSILTDGLSDYYRVNEGSLDEDYSHHQGASADGYKVGSTTTTWEIFKLRFDRARQFQIDSASNEETDEMVVGNTVVEFMRTRVVPEIDAVRFSTIAEYCSPTLGNLVTEADIAAANVLAKFNAAIKWLHEHEVPDEDQIIYVNPNVMAMIRDTPALTKYLSQSDYRDGDINFTITRYMGRVIKEVPSSRFYTDVKVTGNGFEATAGKSKVINYMIVSKKAVVPVVKIQDTKIYGPEVVQDFDGYKINFRIFHDLIVPKNKVIASFVSLGADLATNVTNLLEVALVEGRSQNGYIVKGYYSRPAGIRGKLVFKKTAMTLGSIEAGATTIPFDPSIQGGVEIINATDATGYFALLDSDNRVLATSKQITLPKKGA